MNPFSELEKILIGVVAALGLAVAAVLWWHVHNERMVNIGVAKCEQAVAVPKEVAAVQTAADERAQTDQIKTAVEDRDAKINRLSSDNAALVGWMRGNANRLRAGALPGPGGSAVQCPTERGLPESQGSAQERQQRIDADLIALLDACDATYASHVAVTEIYDSARQRSLDRAGEKKPAAK